MGDEGDRHTTDRRQLEARLTEIEGRLRAVERESLTSDESSISVDAELGVIREALDDLASDVFDLHNQMATLVSASERMLAGAAGGGLDITLDRGARGSAFVVRRAARRAVRATLGVARRAFGSGADGERAGPDIDIRLAATLATRSPNLSVIVETEDELDESDALTIFGNQTDPDTEIVVWNPGTGVALVRGGANPVTTVEATDRRSLVEKIGADFVARPMNPFRQLLPTVLEICRWTLASEGVPLIVGGFPARGRSMEVLRIRRADDWCDEEDPTASLGGPAVIKLVGSASRRTPGPPGSALVWSEAGGLGGYLLTDTKTAAVTHEVAALEGVVSPTHADDPRPHVLLATPLSGGAFELTMWLLQGLGDAFRFTVLLTEDCSAKARLVRAMAELAPEVYPLANFLEPSVWPSVVVDLARARKVTTVLRIGGAGALALDHDETPPIVDLPLDPSLIGSGAETLVALSNGIAGAAGQGGIDVVMLTAAPNIPLEPPDPEVVATVRSGLGVSADHLLVVDIADLVSEQRPEDFVAVAHRMRHRRDIHFLLVGEGDLTGTVSDIARYFGLENFSLAPQTRSTFELVLAADIVMSTAERDPWPTPTIAALALGRRLVVTDIEGRREVVANWPEDRIALVQPGDVAGLAGAIETAVSGMRKPNATKKAWKIARTQTTKGLRVMADVLQARGADTKGDG